MRVQPWHDCPTCPDCGGPTGVPRSAHGGGEEYDEAHTVICVCCGHGWAATEAELAQSVRAQLAWEAVRDIA